MKAYKLRKYVAPVPGFSKIDTSRSISIDLSIFTIITRVASAAKRAKRAERNDVERVCGGRGDVQRAAWSVCLFVCPLSISRVVLNGFS